MVLGCFWWFLLVLGGSWWFLVVLGWLLVVVWGFEWFLVFCCGFVDPWWFLMRSFVFGIYWCFLVITGGSLCIFCIVYLKVFGGAWWFLVVLCCSLCLSGVFGGSLLCLVALGGSLGLLVAPCNLRRVVFDMFPLAQAAELRSRRHACAQAPLFMPSQGGAAALAGQTVWRGAQE